MFQEFTDDPAHYHDRRFTHVIAPFDIPREWRVYRSYDFGYAKPFSVGWWAVDFDGVIYRILELYGCTTSTGSGGSTGAANTTTFTTGDSDNTSHSHTLGSGSVSGTVSVSGTADTAAECQVTLAVDTMPPYLAVYVWRRTA